MQLQEIYPDVEARSISHRLFEHYLSVNKIDIALQSNDIVVQDDKLDNAVKNLLANEPLQYVLGFEYFYDLEFAVSSDVLIPRPETEELVQLILNNHKNEKISLLDIGTGSGCIPISIKYNHPLMKVSACDVSEKALQIAQSNAIKNGVGVNFFYCDILDRENWQQNKYDIIVSNPPYVLQSEKTTMQENVLDFEPHLALFVDDSDPLLFYNNIADFATKHLHTNGSLYFEINEKFGEETKSMLESKGYSDVCIHKDIFGKDRMVSAKF